MGRHVAEQSFEPSVTFITTDNGQRELPYRVPMVGAHAGCMFGRQPGASVKALNAELRDLRGDQTAKGQSRFLVAQRVSRSGVLRNRRIVA